MTRHYSEEELADYAFDPAAFREKAEVEAHLAGCSDCRERFELIEKIDGVLRETGPWEISDDITSQTTPVPSESLQTRARVIDDERAQARSHLEPLLASPQKFRSANVDQDVRFHTAGAVSVLYESAKDLHDNQPRFALLVADAAVVIANKLAKADGLRSMLHLARAHLEQGRALLFIGRYKGAEESLDKAEQAYDLDDHTTGWDLATVWLIRANIFVESERLFEARLLATAAARQFRIFGDVARYLNAKLLLASVLFMEGDYRASAQSAEEIIQQCRTRAGTALNTGLLARALQNCGEAYLLLREYETAVSHFLEAFTIWDELGLETERIRTNWSLATVDTETGQLENGIRRLDETYRAFEALGVVNDAALARMQLGETLLRAGRPEPVPDLLRDVVVSFATEGMLRNARIALAYLHEAIEQNRLSADLVRHVRTYIEQLPFHPGTQFVPLQ